VTAAQALYALGPAETRQGFAALIVVAKLLNQRHQINRSGGHSVTMPKSKKHPIEMTSDELAAHVFHRKLHKALKKHVKKVDAESLVKSARKRAK
jgi:hypothetical protein